LTKIQTVLVSRPRHQQRTFINLCQSIGLSTVSLPLLRIRPIALPDNLWQPHVNNPSIAWVFTSRNAVTHCPLKDKPAGPVFAMGASTAQALEASGRQVAIQPEVPFNSEALVEQLRHYAITAAAVVTGMGGRAWLGDKLIEMGWTVNRLACYERLAETHKPHIVVGAINASDVLSLTSIESMDALLQLVSQAEQHALSRPLAPKLDADWQEKPLIVNSERAITAAREAEFTGQIYVAVPAGDEGQFLALQEWCNAQAVTR